MPGALVPHVVLAGTACTVGCFAIIPMICLSSCIIMGSTVVIQMAGAQEIIEQFSDRDLPAHLRRRIYGSFTTVLAELKQALHHSRRSSVVATGHIAAREGHCVQSYVPHVTRHKTALQRRDDCAGKRSRPHTSANAVEANHCVQPTSGAKFVKTSRKIKADTKKTASTFDERSAKWVDKVLEKENAAAVREAPLTCARPPLQPIIADDAADTIESQGVEMDDMVYLLTNGIQNSMSSM